MISSKEMAHMNVEQLAQAIETHHQELALLYQAIANKISKETIGEKSLKDDNLFVAEYWLKVAKDHPEILAADFDTHHFEEKLLLFKTVVDVNTQNQNAIVLLKTARDNASKDCSWYISYVRKRVKELEYNPVFKLLLQKEPNQRQPTVKQASKS
jgi:predicted O-linked N-acetylglucosamine transferase (SPINDLY family)